MHTKSKTQSEIVETIRNKIRWILQRPKMYVGPSSERLYEFLCAYVDCLAMAHSGSKSGMLFGDIARPDPSKTEDENIKAIVDAVEDILAEPLIELKEKKHSGEY